jgi:hypothetical protein
MVSLKQPLARVRAGHLPQGCFDRRGRVRQPRLPWRGLVFPEKNAADPRRRSSFFRHGGAACLWTHDCVVACGHSAEIALRLGVAAGGHRIAADHCAGNLSLRCDWPRRVAALPVRVRGLNCCPDVLRLRRGFFLRSSRPDCQRAGCKDQSADSFDLLRHCRSPFARTQDERSDRRWLRRIGMRCCSLPRELPLGQHGLGRDH